ncbi:hypothetical protein M427DRAFT_136156 [Gonapodya prolifera JEL478]|uniref:Cytochrome P450 n=1 Tax=Gonapodya prolifera (strain JEL478) TaxID=1344416 RepID=A0A139AAS7_GONPJ|nr:hypothetical protein M427DRAFT_136156 [Gonapodya prolifera JEL478]|eukprot:KXS13847.1 hypothetical protein M427DRAFT_136156 [Gonapodya prolifera JEL478]
MWYDNAALIAETKQNYQEWADLFGTATVDRRARRATMGKQDAVLGGRSIPTDQVTPTMKDLADMGLPDCMIAENIWLATVSFTSFSQHSPRTRAVLEDVQIDNTSSPPGSWNFNPDRTLPKGGKVFDLDSSKQIRLVEGGHHANYNLAVWGLGKHPCAGAWFASAVIKLAISLIV